MRTSIQALCFSTLIACTAGSNAIAQPNPQNFPTKAVRIVVPFPGGGPADMLARLLSEKLNERWGQPVLVENVGGAAGNIGADQVARAAPDGSMILLNASSHVINGIMYTKLPYDPFKDFTPITQVASYQHMLVVHPSVPARTLKELIEFAKSKPGQLTIGNSGYGTPGHLAAEHFRTTAGIDIVHVPYKGSAPATTDLIGGQVNAMFNNPVNTLPFIAAGKMRALAVTSKERLPAAPDIPTVVEAGFPGFEAGTWFGFYGPANLPPAIVTKIHEEVVRALRLPDVRQKLAAQAWNIIGNNPAEFLAVMKTDHEVWSRVIKSAGIRVE